MLRICKSTYQSLALPDLHRIKITDRGNRSARWQGIQHGTLVDTLREILKRLFNFKPLADSERYYVSPNGAILIGGFDLADSLGQPVLMTDPGDPHPVGASIGFTHSNNSDKSLSIVAGGTCFLCENGVSVGETKLKHKHTSSLRLRDWLTDGLQDFWERLKAGFRKILALHRSAFADVRDSQILRLAREGCLPWRLLGDLEDLWQGSFAAGHALWVPEPDRTKWPVGVTSDGQYQVWDWYNAITHIIKRLPPSQQFQSLQQALTIVQLS